MSNVLIVYAHPETPESFNRDVRDALMSALPAEGHAARLRDLYALGFDPRLSGADLAAIASGKTPGDVLAEQEAVSWSDVLVFLYPVWWAGPPAILKGWFDRVLSRGFAYDFRDGEKVGLLAPRRAIALSSHGNSKEAYLKGGYYKAFGTIDEGTLGYCGFSEVRHVFYGSMAGKSAAEKSRDVASAASAVLDFMKGRA